MKNKIKKVIVVIVSVFIFIFSYIKVSCLLASKDSMIKYQEFYQETEEYDVLFLGSSHMMNTIYPMELWKQYGIVSYNLANSAEAIPGSYWVLKNALEYKKPKVVVVDCFISGYFKTFPEQESFSHMFFDTLPLSKNKIAALNDLLPEQMEEYVWTFSLYHNRWNELNKEDFKLTTVPHRGASILTGYSNIAEMTFTNEATEVNSLTTEYIRLMKELCDEQQIKLVLCCMPYAAYENEQQVHNGFYKLTEELGISYLNLIPAGIVDYEIDMHDRGHLNASGARKVNEYMGEWLIENCDLHARRDLESWNKDYLEYQQEKYDTLTKQTNLYAELLLLHDQEFDVSIILKDPKILSDDPILNKMIHNVTHLKLEYSQTGTSDIEIQVLTDDGESEIDHKYFNRSEDGNIYYIRSETES